MNKAIEIKINDIDDYNMSACLTEIDNRIYEGDYMSNVFNDTYRLGSNGFAAGKFKITHPE
jgi:predicted DNA-binding protein